MKGWIKYLRKYYYITYIIRFDQNLIINLSIKTTFCENNFTLLFPSMSYSNKLVCHFFHQNSCHKKNCKFLHSPAPLGYCPNAQRCPIKHNTIDCPTYQKFNECTIHNCCYSHPEGYKKPKTANGTKLEKEEAIIQNDFDDQASCAELSRHLKEINNDLKMMIPLEDNIKPMMDLDVMIIMDCTGSMSPWIEAAKKELKSIIDIIVEQHTGIKIRISFVAYRDFCDKDQYEIQPFISDIDVVRKFISGLRATGGGDQAEDVAGGLTYALQQNWKAKAKYAIFIADSPAHGEDYYYYANDDYPKGDPKGRKIETLMETFGTNDVNFYAIKINDSTDRMYEVMSEYYHRKSGKKLQIANLGSSTKCFGFFVTCTINQTISQTSLRDNVNEINNMLLNLKQNKKSTLISYSNNIEEEKVEPQKNVQIKELNLEMDHSPCNWNKTKYSNLPAICHTWFIVKDLNVSINWRKPLIQKSQISTHVWINTKPFSAGAMRYAFFMKDLDLDQKLVAKIPKVLDQNYIPEIMMKDVESIFICNHIVNEFNDRIVSIVPDPDMLISFVHSFIYEITLENFPYKYWWVENFIEGEYEKFNNNAGWEAASFKQTSLVAQCLSHFSWQFTNGFLMIVDLQGGTGILTDPQIHCLDSKRFGKGNLGYEGILKFFFTHKCNFYCQRLGLLNPKTTFELPNDFKFYKNVLEKPYNDETIHKLCDLCRQPYKIGSFQYFNSRAKYPELYCKDCNFKKMSTMKEGKCIDCSSTFRSSEYWFKMKRTDFPVRCSKCRLENRNKLRKAIKENEGKMEEEFI